MTKPYTPIIKWKQGEYLALARLHKNIKPHVKPLIEVTPIEWDFEENKEAKTLDEHMAPFAKKYKKNWGEGKAYVDTYLLKEALLKNKINPITFIFDSLTNTQHSLIPVTRISRPFSYHLALKKIVKKHKIDHICFRVTIDDLMDTKLAGKLTALSKLYNVPIKECDLVIDLESPEFSDIPAFSEVLWDIVRTFPHLNKWKNITICGTSFPETMSVFKVGMQTISRYEWLLYKQLLSTARPTDRIPNFGDYGIAHHKWNYLDMRKIKPSASIKYTIDDGWQVVKGTQTRVKNGFAQFKNHAAAILNSGLFVSKDYSLGDKYIEDCANGKASTGNLSVWVWVGKNHHYTKVVNDLFSIQNAP